MSKFKVGDKVTLSSYLGDINDVSAPTIGQVMIITGFHDNPNVPFPINTDEGLWSECELTLFVEENVE